MKISITEESDPNYLASVFALQHIKPHSNADKLMLATVFGNQVIISKENYEGQKMLYFPVESCIAAEYLSWANMFDDVSLNADQTKPKGYFSTKRRVKAVKLRGEPSNGIVIPVKNIVEFLNQKYDIATPIEESDFKEGNSFDQIQLKSGDVDITLKLVEKYIPKTTTQGEPKDPKAKNKDLGISKLLLPNQFRFHSKTTQLGMAVHTVKPDDIVSVSNKLHGTSAVFSNVLCRVVPSWIDKIAKFFGANIKEQEYKFVYSSRSVIKNRKNQEYTNDVWGQWAETLDGKLPNGFTVYGEVVGYTKNGNAIQKGYAYGEPLLSNNLYVYRVTYTDSVGEVLEFDWQQIGDFCEKYILDRVPTFFHGKASDLFDIDPEDQLWNEKFLENLKDTYLEKPCELCANGKIREGICLRRENTPHKNAWKLKSFGFLQQESLDRDKGETNMEEES